MRIVSVLISISLWLLPASVIAFNDSSISCVFSVQHEVINSFTHLEETLTSLRFTKKPKRGQIFRSFHLDMVLRQLHLRPTDNDSQRIPPSAPKENLTGYLVLKVLGNKALLTPLTIGRRTGVCPGNKQFPLEYTFLVDFKTTGQPTEQRILGKLDFDIVIPEQPVRHGLRVYPEPVTSGSGRIGGNNPTGIETLRMNDLIYVPQAEGSLPHNPCLVLSVDDDAGNVTVLRLQALEDDMAIFESSPQTYHWEPNEDYVTKINNLGKFPQVIRGRRWEPIPRAETTP